MKFKHIIWDYNGTLLNDVQLCVDVMNSMLIPRGLPEINSSIYKAVFDFPVKDYYAELGFDFEKESFEKVGTEFIVKYDEQQRSSTKLHKDTDYILQEISRSGISQSVLSARKEAKLIEELEFFGIAKYFNKIVGLNDHYAAGKLENGKKLVSELKLNPTEIALVGDTVHDCEVAVKTGINPILISHGHHTIERLEKCKITVFNDLREVWEYISG